MKKEKDKTNREIILDYKQEFYGNKTEIERLRKLEEEWKKEEEFLLKTAKRVDDEAAISAISTLNIKRRILPHKLEQLAARNDEIQEECQPVLNLVYGDIDAILTKIKTEAVDELRANLGIFLPADRVDTAINRIYTLSRAGEFVYSIANRIIRERGMTGIEACLYWFEEIDKFLAWWEHRHDGAGKQITTI